MHMRTRAGRSSWVLAILLGATTVGHVACEARAPEETPTSAPAAVTAPATPAAPAVTPVVSFNALMVALVDNASHVLWDVEKPGFWPKDDAEWVEVEDHAMQLAAASTLLQLGGTGQADLGWIKQAGWVDHARALGAAGLAANAAAKSRNKEALVKANSDLVASCEGCHKAFKPELPTEGLAHQRPHSESHRSNK